MGELPTSPLIQDQVPSPVKLKEQDSSSWSPPQGDGVLSVCHPHGMPAGKVSTREKVVAEEGKLHRGAREGMRGRGQGGEMEWPSLLSGQRVHRELMPVASGAHGLSELIYSRQSSAPHKPLSIKPSLEATASPPHPCHRRDSSDVLGGPL